MKIDQDFGRWIGSTRPRFDESSVRQNYAIA
jgi:hypothetical protein